MRELILTHNLLQPLQQRVPSGCTGLVSRTGVYGRLEEVPAESAFPRVSLHHLGAVWAFLFRPRASPTHSLSTPLTDRLPNLHVCVAFRAPIRRRFIRRRLGVEICLALWAARGFLRNLALAMGTRFCIPSNERKGESNRA